MLQKSLMLLFLVLAICFFCANDFVSLGRHSWGCKSKLNVNEESFEDSTQNTFRNTEATIDLSLNDVNHCAGHNALWY